MAIQIITDSACDYSQEEAKALSITIIPLSTYFGETEYKDGCTISHEEFFEKLIETDILPTTSQISPYEYDSLFSKFTECGDEVLCITLSSKLSGCYQSACIASSEYGENVYIVDSLNACVGQQILVALAVRLRDQGMSASKIADILNEEKSKIRLLALIDTMEYLKKGGRISAATAMAGSLLSIKPVIALSNGEVVAIGKARGSKAGNNKLSELINHEGEIDFDKPFALAYSGLDKGMLIKYIKDFSYLYENKSNPDDFQISSIGSTIGTHIGPGAIGVAFFVK